MLERRLVIPVVGGSSPTAGRAVTEINAPVEVRRKDTSVHALSILNSSSLKGEKGENKTTRGHNQWS